MRIGACDVLEKVRYDALAPPVPVPSLRFHPFRPIAVRREGDVSFASVKKSEGRLDHASQEDESIDHPFCGDDAQLDSVLLRFLRTRGHVMLEASTRRPEMGKSSKLTAEQCTQLVLRPLSREKSAARVARRAEVSEKALYLSPEEFIGDGKRAMNGRRGHREPAKALERPSAEVAEGGVEALRQPRRGEGIARSAPPALQRDASPLSLCPPRSGTRLRRSTCTFMDRPAASRTGGAGPGRRQETRVVGVRSVFTATLSMTDYCIPCTAARWTPSHQSRPRDPCRC